MGMLRLVGIVIVGALSSTALSASSFAKGSETWHVDSAFERAQGLRNQNFTTKKYKRRETNRGFLFGGNDEDRGFFNFRKQRFSDRKRKRKFRDIDPEAD